MSTQLKYSKEETEVFYKYYSEGHSLKETAKHFDVNYRDVLHYMLRYGYYTPKKKLSKKKNLCINQDYFQEINTPEKAYFLGLLFSDGNIRSGLYSKTISIALQSRDKYILDRLKDIICPEKTLNKYKNSYKLTVQSDKMYDDLMSYGIVENKSQCNYVYPNIPKEFDRDFIRGYFDGDGCITKKSTGYFVISICSNSKIFLESLKEKLLEYDIKTRPIYSTNNNRNSAFHTLYFSGGDNKLKVRDFFYNGSSIYLIRKYDKFKEIPC